MRKLLSFLLLLFLTCSPAWAGVDLNGDADYLSRNNVDLGNNFTLYAVYSIDSHQAVSIISEDYTGSGGVSFVLGYGTDDGDNDKLKCGFFNVSWRQVAETGTSSTDTIYRVACTWNGTTMKLFVNGVLNNSSTPGGSTVDENNDTFIGRRHDNFYGPEYFNGKIYEVALWNDDLTDSEAINLTAGQIKRNFLQFKPSNCIAGLSLDQFSNGVALNTTSESYISLCSGGAHFSGVDADGDSLNEAERSLSYP